MAGDLDVCPFCRGEARMRRDREDERTAYRAVVTISCLGCGASITRYGDTSKPGYADNSRVDADAIAAWNTRTSAPDESRASVVEADLDRETTRIAKLHGCDRGTFTVCWGEQERGEVCRCKEDARQALAAPASGERQVPEGWVLVPREPTREMLDALNTMESPATVWSNTLATAPQPSAEPDSVKEGE